MLIIEKCAKAIAKIGEARKSHERSVELIESEIRDVWANGLLCEMDDGMDGHDTKKILHAIYPNLHRLQVQVKKLEQVINSSRAEFTLRLLLVSDLHHIRFGMSRLSKRADDLHLVIRNKADRERMHF